MLLMLLLLVVVQVESAGRDHRGAVGCRHHPGGDRVRPHSNQPDHHPRHAGHENRSRYAHSLGACCCRVTYF